MQGERAGPVGGIGAIDHCGREEEERLQGRDRHRRDRESKLDLAARDHERDDLCGQRARRNRMGQRQERGTDGVHHPPHHVAAVDRAREERRREEHRGERQRERPDRSREQHGSERGREHEGCGRTRVAAGEAAAQAIGRYRGDHGGDHRRQPHPQLGVVPRHDGTEQRHVSRAGGVVRQRMLDDVGEGASSGDHRHCLVRVEGTVTECGEAEHERETGAEVRQHAVENDRCTCVHGNRLAGRRRGVGRSAHPNRG